MTNDKDMNNVITCIYDLFVDGQEGQEELMQRVTRETPLTYCEDFGMMLPLFEEALRGKKAGDKFDFRIGCEDAYGPYDTDAVLTLDKKLFYNGDGEFDDERVVVGNMVPMQTVDGQIVRAMVVEITDDKVTIDLNDPLAGENLHFVGEILEVRDATEEELEQLRHPHKCCGKGGCHKGECHKDEQKNPCGEDECGGCGRCR